MEDEAGAQEADALDDVGGHAALVRVGVAGQHRRQERKKCAAHADEQVGAHARGLAVDLALQADKSAQQTGHEQAADGVVDHHDLLQPVENEGLGELCQGRTHGISWSDAITAPACLLSPDESGVPET